MKQILQSLFVPLLFMSPLMAMDPEPRVQTITKTLALTLQQQLSQNPQLAKDASFVQQLIQLQNQEISQLLAHPTTLQVIIQLDIRALISLIEKNPALLNNEAFFKRLVSIAPQEMEVLKKKNKSMTIWNLCNKHLPMEQMLKLAGTQQWSLYFGPGSSNGNAASATQTSGMTIPSFREPIPQQQSPALPMQQLFLPPAQDIQKKLKQITPIAKTVPFKPKSEVPLDLKAFMESVEKTLTPEQRIAMARFAEERRIRDLDYDPEFNRIMASLKDMSLKERAYTIDFVVIPRIWEASYASACHNSRYFAIDTRGKTKEEIIVERNEKVVGFCSKTLMAAKDQLYKVLEKKRDEIHEKGIPKTVFDTYAGIVHGIGKIIDIHNTSFISLLTDDPVYNEKNSQNMMDLSYLVYAICKNPEKTLEMFWDSAIALGTIKSTNLTARILAKGTGALVVDSLPTLDRHMEPVYQWVRNKLDSDFMNFSVAHQDRLSKYLPQSSAVALENNPIFDFGRIKFKLPKVESRGLLAKYLALDACVSHMPTDHDQEMEQLRAPVSSTTLDLLARTPAHEIAFPTELSDATSTHVATLQAKDIDWSSKESKPYQMEFEAIPNLMNTNIFNTLTVESGSISDYKTSVSVDQPLLVLFKLAQKWNGVAKSNREFFKALEREDTQITNDHNYMLAFEQTQKDVRACLTQLARTNNPAQQLSMLLYLNRLHTSRLPGKTGHYVGQLVDAVNKQFFDSEGNLKPFDDRDKKVAGDFYNEFLKATCTRKDEYLSYLTQAQQDGVAYQALIEQAQKEDFSQTKDVLSWGETLKRFLSWPKAKEVSSATILDNVHNKKVLEIREILHQASEIATDSSYSDYNYMCHLARRATTAYSNNKQNPTLYRNIVKWLYKQHHRSLFGKDTSIDEITMPKHLTRDPLWSKLSAEEQSAIRTEPTLLNQWHKDLATRHKKYRVLREKFGFQEGALEGLFYDLIPTVHESLYIDKKAIVNALITASNELVPGQRADCMRLLQRYMVSNNTYEQFALFRALQYAATSFECKLPDHALLYQELARSQAAAEYASPLNRYNFCASTGSAEYDFSQKHILQLVVEACKVAEAHPEDMRHSKMFSEYHLRLAGAAQRALALGRYEEARALATMPAQLLGVDDSTQLPSAIENMGLLQAISKVTNSSPANAVDRMQKYSEWLKAQEQLDSSDQFITRAHALEKSVINLGVQENQNLLPAYARLANLITYGRQLTREDNKAKALADIDKMSKLLHTAAQHYLNPQTAQNGKSLLMAFHCQAKVVEDNLKELLTKEGIDLQAYGAYRPDLYSLLGIPFAGNFVEQARATARENQFGLTLITEDEEATYLGLSEIKKYLKSGAVIQYQAVVGQELSDDAWEDLAPEKLQELKDSPLALFAREVYPVSAAQQTAIEKVLNGGHFYNNRPPKKDDEKDEIDRLVDTMNKMISEAEPDWQTISDMLKKDGIIMSPEELEALFKPLTMHYDHVFRPDIKFRYNPNTRSIECTFSGHHLYDGPCKVVYENVNRLCNGIIKADPNVGGLIRSGNFYFPENWKEIDIVKAVIEVLKNPTYATIPANGRLKLRGTYKGVDMIVLLDKTKSLTTFPWSKS